MKSWKCQRPNSFENRTRPQARPAKASQNATYVRQTQKGRCEAMILLFVYQQTAKALFCLSPCCQRPWTLSRARRESSYFQRLISLWREAATNPIFLGSFIFWHVFKTKMCPKIESMTLTCISGCWFHHFFIYMTCRVTEVSNEFKLPPILHDNPILLSSNFPSLPLTCLTLFFFPEKKCFDIFPPSSKSVLPHPSSLLQ